jgi:hypothetical protein
MSALAKEHHAHQDAHEKQTRRRAVDRRRRPRGNHGIGGGHEHPPILADPVDPVTLRPLWNPFESELVMLFAGVSLSPSTSDLPGSAALQSIADGIASWALIGALVALLLGAVLWAIGSHTQNMHQSTQGRRAVLTSLVAAILIGAAPELINFFFNAGVAVH